MRIQSNWISLVSWRAFSHNASDLEGSLSKLSSGLRVSTAADDVAGLAISNRMLAQYRGLVQANRNAMDGVSLVNTAEGALQEINTMLARGKELSLQAANGVLTKEGRESIQVEIQNILTEIDRISDTTTFNGIRLFNSEGASGIAALVTGLKTSWLEQSAKVISNYLGLQGDGATMQVAFATSGPSAAWVTGTPSIDGMLTNVQVHIDVSQFASQSAIEGDRKVARALTLATLARNTDYVAMPDWFKSGVADFIAGRDEQLKADIATYGLANLLATADNLQTQWADDNLHQSAAYLMVKYINWRTGNADGIKDIMNFLQLASGGSDLDTAVQNVLSRNIPTVFGEFAGPGPDDAAAFLATLNLNDPDVGGVNPGTNATVIPDVDAYTDTPLAPKFDVKFSMDDLMKPVTITLQVGANVSDWIKVTIPHLSTLGLQLLGIDVVNHADAAIDAFAKATGKVSSIRSELGAQSNRLESTIRANNVSAENELSSYSRIRDLDFAKQLTDYTKQQILVSSSGAMLAQANSMRQNVRWLLNGLSMPKMGGSSGGMAAAMGTG